MMGFLSCNAESAIATCDSHYWDLKRRTHHNNNSNRIREFHFSELLAGTGGFSPDTFLGKGSHGSVYRATLDGGRLVAAVKRTADSNEIEILARVRDPRRFVNLIGFSADPNSGRQLMVVEYMANGSLYDALHSTARPPGWNRRVRFALQVAKAVQALHSADPPVIHRDIKSSNVLIDEKKRARLGDFGLALRGHVEDVRVACTPPAGTMGYLDPSYVAPSDVSAKSDVFSFGILLLEILSGRKAIDLNHSPPSVVDWALPIIKRGDFQGICDPRIRPGTGLVEELGRLAATCVRSTAEKRPSMAEAVERLQQQVRRGKVWRRRERNGKVSSVDKVDANIMPHGMDGSRSSSISMGGFADDPGAAQTSISLLETPDRLLVN